MLRWEPGNEAFHTRVQNAHLKDYGVVFVLQTVLVNTPRRKTSHFVVSCGIARIVL